MAEISSKPEENSVIVEDNDKSETIVSDVECTKSESLTSQNVPDGSVPTMSKNQQKKLKKLERLKEIRAEKNKHQKEQRKLKRAQLREEGGADFVAPPSKRRLKKNAMENSSCKIRVVLDCSFDHLMSEKDVRKLVQQVQYSYSSNRRAAQPLQLYLTSLGGNTKSRLEQIGDYQGWDMHMKSGSYMEEFKPEEIVYLTSDSSNILQTLDPQKVYVIGGLVDHNHYKGHCYDVAVKQGVSHAQLPIGDHIKLTSRKVLTVNHVFEILLRFTETNDWKEAFHQVIPKRKQADESADHESADHESADQDLEQDQIDNESDSVNKSESNENLSEVTEIKCDTDADKTGECSDNINDNL